MLLRGLAARLDVRVQYMDIMAPYAKQVLYEAKERKMCPDLSLE